MMGYSYSSSDTPEMCFNAAKSWQLGWYSNKHRQINVDNVAPGTVLYNGQLAYFNEDLQSPSTPPMIIKLNTSTVNFDFYMFFNRKVDFNSGVIEGGNQVMITEMGGEGNGYAESELKAKLSAGGTYTESNTGTLIEVTSIGTRATVKICKGTCSTGPVPTALPTSSPSVEPPSPTESPTTASPTVEPQYVEVFSERCETFGYESIYTKQECIDAATSLRRTIIWGPHGGYQDVVDGCSARGTYSQTQLFLNPKGVCDPSVGIGTWTYTGCKCASWMPCLCRNSDPRITEAPSAVPTDVPSDNPIAVQSDFPSVFPSDSPSIAPSDAPTIDRCDIMDVVGQTIYVPGAGSCWRIQLGRGGTLEGDSNGNESCQKDESDWQSSIILSNFSSVLPNDDIAVFEAKVAGQWKGTFLFKEDPTATKPYLVPPLVASNGKFELVVAIPTCSADAICPTMKVNLF